MNSCPFSIGRVAVLALMIAVCNPEHLSAQTGVSKEVRTQISKRTHDYLAKLHADAAFPGASLAIVLPDSSLMTVTIGNSSRESDQPIQPSDRMMSGSIGKTYFAAMAMELVHQNKISLDDKLETHLGTTDWFKRIPNASELTVAHLMRHQSGLPRYIENQRLWRDIMSDPNMTWTPGQQLVYIYDQKPLHAAGEGWAYSDTNYILLGLLLEKVSRQSVYKYVEDKFLEPNQLEDTIPSNSREIPGLIQGYTNIFKGMGIPEKVAEDGKFVFNPAMEWCGGGYANTPADLARWAHILYSDNLLDKKYVATMTEGAVVARMLGPETKYGLGVIIRETKAGTLLGHDGVFPGYTSSMGYFSKHNVAIACMINSDGKALRQPLHEVLVDVAAIVVEEIKQD